MTATGLPGSPKNTDRPQAAESERTPGTDGNPPESELAVLTQHRLDIVRLAGGDAAGGNDDIGAAGGAEQGRFDQRPLVADDALVFHVHAHAGQQTEQRVAIAVVDAAFAGRLPGAAQLVAGREERPP